MMAFFFRPTDPLARLLVKTPVSHLHTGELYGVNFPVDDIALLQVALPKSCVLNITVLSNKSYFAELKTYLTNQPSAAEHLVVRNQMRHFETFKLVVSSLQSIRKKLINYEISPYPASHFKALNVWRDIAQCSKLNNIQLYFETQLLLTVEHIRELLPICKNLRCFKLFNVTMSETTFSKLRAWIRLNMPRLEHKECLQNVKFISEGEERYLLTLQTPS